MSEGDLPLLGLRVLVTRPAAQAAFAPAGVPRSLPLKAAVAPHHAVAASLASAIDPGRSQSPSENDTS